VYHFTVADTHLSGNDIIQKYSVSRLLFIFLDSRQSESAWCELGITWAVENSCLRPQEKETVVCKYFFPLTQFLQRLDIAREVF